MLFSFQIFLPKIGVGYAFLTEMLSLGINIMSNVRCISKYIVPRTSKHVYLFILAKTSIREHNSFRCENNLSATVHSDSITNLFLETVAPLNSTQFFIVSCLLFYYQLSVGQLYVSFIYRWYGGYGIPHRSRSATIHQKGPKHSMRTKTNVPSDWAISCNICNCNRH